MKRFLAAFLLPLFLLYGKSAVKREKKKELKEEIVVVAERSSETLLSLSSTTEMVNAKELKRFRLRDLKEALSLLPSVYVPNFSSHAIPSSVFLRGVDSSRGLFTLNSVPLTDPNLFSLPFDFVPSFFLASIESVMGPQSALWGNSAMGSVTNISLDKSKGNEIEIMGGGMSTLSFQGKTGYQGRNFLLKGGYSYFNNEGVAENNRFKRNSFYAVSEARIGSWKFSPTVIYTNQLGFIPFVFRDLPAKDRRARDIIFLAQVPASVQWDKFSFTITPYYYSKDYKFTAPHDPWHLTNFSTFLESEGFTSAASLTFTNYIKISAGFDLRRDSLTSKNNFSVQYKDLKLNYYSLWSNLIYERGRLFISAGGSYNRSSNFGSKFSPKFGASIWALKDRAKVRFSYSEGFRFPVPAEFTGFWGNPDLLPERSKGYEGGIDILPWGNFLISTTAFRTDFQDLIFYDYLTSKFGNIGKVRIQGWETTIRGSWKKYSGILGFTKLSARDIVKNNKLLRRPDLMIKAVLSYLPFSNSSINLLFLYIGKRKDFDDKLWEQVQDPSYYIVNVIFNWKSNKGFGLFLRGDNILNKKYQDIFGYPSPKRTIYAGIDFVF